MSGECDDFFCEGAVRIYRTREANTGVGPGRKGKEAFYNRAMKMNRDISVAVLRNLPDGIRVLDAMGATGIRGIRYEKEGGEKEVHVCDISEEAVKTIKRNAELNDAHITVHYRDANILMREIAFDFIDIDPFGTPAPFIDSALAGIKNGGVIAMTATDTAPLAGTYPEVCRRRYMATPLHSHFSHETGLRILIGFAVRMGARYDIALTPILSYYSGHYFRTFLRAKKGAGVANRALENNIYFTYNRDMKQWDLHPSKESAGQSVWGVEGGGKRRIYGPLWGGSPGDKDFLKKVLSAYSVQGDKDEKTLVFLDRLAEENEAPLFFHDIDVISSMAGMSPPPRERVMEAISDAERTHFSPLGFKTKMRTEEVVEVFRKIL